MADEWAFLDEIVAEFSPKVDETPSRKRVARPVATPSYVSLEAHRALTAFMPQIQEVVDTKAAWLVQEMQVFGNEMHRSVGAAMDALWKTQDTRLAALEQRVQSDADAHRREMQELQAQTRDAIQALQTQNRALVDSVLHLVAQSEEAYRKR